MSVDTLQELLKQQEAWAGGRARWPGRPDYVATLEENLLLGGLRADTESEIRGGDGSELEPTGSRPPKMRALLSSSALAANVFDYWRDKDAGSLGVALGLAASIRSLRFEVKCKNYPVPPRSPNLDVMLDLADGSRVAIESKFTEPYGSKSRALSPRYFPKGRTLWADGGLPGAQVVADGVGQHWKSLDAAQLLKHMLGLACDRSEAATTLLCLWFDAGTAEAHAHREELARFARAVDGDRVRFRSMTYQELFANLLRTADLRSSAYHRYLAERYFGMPDIQGPRT